MAKTGVVFLEGDTQFLLSTIKYTNSTGGQVAGILFNLNLPTGTNVVSVIDNNNNVVNSSTNGSVEQIGPVTVAAGASIQFHITVGIANLSTAKCPLNFTGYYSDADDCVLGGTDVHTFPKDCISCNNLTTCISAAQAPTVRTETSDYTVQTTDGVVLAGLGANTITLTAAPLANQEVVIKNIDGSTLTIAGNGNNIDGSASYTVTSLDEAIKVKWDGTEWQIIGKQFTTGKAVFTPTAAFATPGDSSLTYNTATGVGYTMGNLYYFTIDLDFDFGAYTTASGNVTIDGVPVNPTATSGVNITRIENVVTGTATATAEISTGGDITILLNDTAAAATIAGNTAFPASTTFTLRLSGFFEI